MTTRHVVARGSIAALLFTVVVSGGVAHAATPPPAQDTTTFCQNVSDDNPFTDVGPGAHHDNILCLAAANVTQGTTPTTYSPSTPVRRDQMASFIARSIDEINRLEVGTSLKDLPGDDDNDDFFDDVDDSNVHKNDIGRLFEAHIVNGSDASNYNPSGLVTRAQMASFINRSEEYLTGSPYASSTDYFTDDNGNVHEPNINGIAGAGIAQGNGTDSYGPNNPVTREQMASFLIRWFAVHEAGGDVTPLPPDIGPDLLSSAGLDADASFAFNQGDPITLEFANPVAVGTSLTITDGFSTAVTLTDAASPADGETAATFVLSNGDRTLTITPTAAVQTSNGSSITAESVTITDSSGITDVDSSVAWNPDKEPIGDVRFKFVQPA